MATKPNPTKARLTGSRAARTAPIIYDGDEHADFCPCADCQTNPVLPDYHDCKPLVASKFVRFVLIMRWEPGDVLAVIKDECRPTHAAIAAAAERMADGLRPSSDNAVTHAKLTYIHRWAREIATKGAK